MHLTRERNRNKQKRKLAVIAAIILAMILPFMGYVKMTSRLIDASALSSLVVAKAESRIGSRYVYGACHSYRQIRNKRQRSFDCSGLVNWSYYQAGSSIGINTSPSLARKGSRVSYSSLKAGDVILFPGHAGIYIGNGKMVHAPNHRSRVKITALNGYWRRKFRCGRRIIKSTTVRDADKAARKKTGGRIYRKETVRVTYSPGVYKTRLTMSVRNKPSIYGRCIGAVKAGTTVNVKKVRNGKWAEIKYRGKTRYMSLKYSTLKRRIK